MIHREYSTAITIHIEFKVILIPPIRPHFLKLTLLHHFFGDRSGRIKRLLIHHLWEIITNDLEHSSFGVEYVITHSEFPKINHCIEALAPLDCRFYSATDATT